MCGSRFSMHMMMGYLSSNGNLSNHSRCKLEEFPWLWESKAKMYGGDSMTGYTGLDATLIASIPLEDTSIVCGGGKCRVVGFGIVYITVTLLPCSCIGQSGVRL